MKIFFDSEFTGLHQKTTLVSLGCISEDGRAFYAEATDYDRSQVSPWLKENVLSHLILTPPNNFPGLADVRKYINEWTVAGTGAQIGTFLREWLSGFDSIGWVEFWGDCLAYDWVLFCELFPVTNEDTAERLPRNVYYIPFDICTLFKIKGVDPDISREDFSGIYHLAKHNALDDARIVKACYERLMSL